MSQNIQLDVNLRHFARNTILEFSKLTQQLFIQLAAATGEEGAYGIVKPPTIDPKLKKSSINNDVSSPQTPVATEQNVANRLEDIKKSTFNHLAHFEHTLQELLRCDKKIEWLIESLQEHQINHSKLQFALSLCEQETVGVFELIESIQTTKRDLDSLINHAYKQIQDYKQSRELTKDTSELIDYASRIRKYTAAPPNFDPTNTEVTAEPPYPDELLMRSGVLAEATPNLTDSIAEEEEAAAKLVTFNFVPTISQIGVNGLGTTTTDANGNTTATIEDEDDFFFDLNADLD